MENGQRVEGLRDDLGTHAGKAQENSAWEERGFRKRMRYMVSHAFPHIADIESVISCS